MEVTDPGTDLAGGPSPNERRLRLGTSNPTLPRFSAGLGLPRHYHVRTCRQLVEERGGILPTNMVQR